jgi:mitochondrial intermediate peptidase
MNKLLLQNGGRMRGIYSVFTQKLLSVKPLISKFSISARNQRENPGLFSFSSLNNPEDFNALTKKCISRCDEIRKDLGERLIRIEQQGYNPSLEETVETLLKLDAISNEVCRVIDSAELCRNVHTSLEFRNEAEKVFSSLSSYIASLNADLVLYRTVCYIIDGPPSTASSHNSHKSTNSLYHQLNEEQQLVASDLRREFEAGGVHLGILASVTGPKQEYYKTKFNTLSKIQDNVTKHETLFMQVAASADDAKFLVGPFSGSATSDTAQYGEHLRKWLGQYVKQDVTTLSSKVQNELLKANGVSDSDRSGSWFSSSILSSSSAELSSSQVEYAICTSRKHVSKPLLASLPEETHRKQVWVGSIAEPEGNRQGLSELVKSRQSLAIELGYDSYANKVLSNSVVGNENDVWKFLTKAAETVKPFATDEIQKLQAHAGTSTSQGQGQGLGPWDISYLSHISKNNHPSASNATNASRKISEYFPLHVAVDALRDITHSLFGLNLIQKPLNVNSSEGWLNGNGNSNSNSNIIKLCVESSDGVPSGTVYLDLHSRPDKFTGSAHFTVQCGCSHTEHIHEHEQNQDQGQGQGQGQEQQLPVVALVFNFPNTNTGGGSESHLLSLNELTTLFHEWGHALHTLLSRTTYQHLSGTRGTLDFVEVPSHLFEYFANDPRCLKRWAKHHITGETNIPSGLLEEALFTKNSYESIDASMQILYSLVDQHIFGSRIGDVRNFNNDDLYHKIIQDSLEIQTEYTVLPVANNHQHNHGHGHGIPVDMWLSQLGITQTHSSNQYQEQHQHQKQQQQQYQYPSLYLPSHTHFVTYGGGYYAYLYAKMAAAHIWNEKFINDPFSNKEGINLWNKMLRHGVSRSPKMMLREMCGDDDIDPVHYFKSITNNK